MDVNDFVNIYNSLNKVSKEIEDSKKELTNFVKKAKSEQKGNNNQKAPNVPVNGGQAQQQQTTQQGNLAEAIAKTSKILREGDNPGNLPATTNGTQPAPVQEPTPPAKTNGTQVGTTQPTTPANTPEIKPMNIKLDTTNATTVTQQLSQATTELTKARAELLKDPFIIKAIQQNPNLSGELDNIKKKEEEEKSSLSKLGKIAGKLGLGLASWLGTFIGSMAASSEISGK